LLFFSNSRSRTLYFELKGFWLKIDERCEVYEQREIKQIKLKTMTQI